jgi:hypothetical protein
MAYSPNTADIINLILQGSANVETIIRANALNQLATATGSYSMGTNKLNALASGILSTDVPNLGQLGSDSQRAYVVTGCVWTGDALGSTRNASMTAGTVMILGIKLTVAAVTARAFTASRDTYIDATDNGDGTALLTYTEVTNNSLSPALALSGTMLNTIRIGVITVGASNIAAVGNIGQGSTGGVSIGAALGASTVAAGSNGSNITATPLNVASGASFSTGGGWCTVAHSTQTYTIQYTGVSSNTLTGVTVLSGSGTVSTGDVVDQVFQAGATIAGAIAGPMGMTDFLGNMIYPTRPYPNLIGYASYSNAFTTTSTSAIPVPCLIAPFVIPAGPARQIMITMSGSSFLSSAAAGTTITATAYIGNSVSGGTAVSPYVSDKVSVASDGVNLAIIAPAVAPQAAGTYTAQLGVTQGAAGTLTLGVGYGTTAIFVELI